MYACVAVAVVVSVSISVSVATTTVVNQTLRVPLLETRALIVDAQVCIMTLPPTIFPHLDAWPKNVRRASLERL
jgi:hypothetical protein